MDEKTLLLLASAFFLGFWAISDFLRIQSRFKPVFKLLCVGVCLIAAGGVEMPTLSLGAAVRTLNGAAVRTLNGAAVPTLKKKKPAAIAQVSVASPMQISAAPPQTPISTPTASPRPAPSPSPPPIQTCTEMGGSRALRSSGSSHLTIFPPLETLTLDGAAGRGRFERTLALGEFRRWERLPGFGVLDANEQPILSSQIVSTRRQEGAQDMLMVFWSSGSAPSRILLTELMRRFDGAKARVNLQFIHLGDLDSGRALMGGRAQGPLRSLFDHWGAVPLGRDKTSEDDLPAVVQLDSGGEICRILVWQ